MKRLIIVLIFLSLSFQLFGQDSSTAVLQQRIADLEKRVEALENTVQKQSIPKSPSVPARLQAWRKLYVGMSADVVRNLLGEPLRITTTGAVSIWNYDENPAYSEVTFMNNKVHGWTEPR